MTTETKTETKNIDALISIGGIRGMTKANALAFLSQKLIFIQGRNIAREYSDLAYEYEMIGEIKTAKELKKKAEELRHEN
jgi:hypothetical protein